jgi:hypothetical protein
LKLESLATPADEMAEHASTSLSHHGFTKNEFGKLDFFGSDCRRARDGFRGTLFRVLEQKSPLLGNDDKSNKLFRRMMFCVWVTSALLSIVLMYQCSP